MLFRLVGEHFPAETRAVCDRSDAILFGYTLGLRWISTYYHNKTLNVLWIGDE